MLGPMLTRRQFFGLVPVALAPAIACGGGRPALVKAEQDLEERLMAPCCWQQTLDVHASPLATELRAEIKQRLVRGESVETIETDLVGRYGERMRAGGGPFLRYVGPFVGVVALAATAGVVHVARKWVRRGAAFFFSAPRRCRRRGRVRRPARRRAGRGRVARR